MSLKTVSIQLPENCEPGDTISFIVNGQDLELVVPPGSEPGDVLEIQVGTDEDNDDNNDNEDGNSNDDDKEGSSGSNNDNQQAKNEKVNSEAKAKESGNTSKPLSSSTTTATTNYTTRVKLGADQVLTLYGALPLDKAQYKDTQQQKQRNDDVANQDETINNNDGTHAMAWPAGVQLVEYLQLIPKNEYNQLFGNKVTSILELGSGLGLVGLAIANLFCQQSFSQQSKKVQIVLSDVPAAIPLLQYNIEQNKHLITTPKVEITVEPLIWTEQNDSNSPSSSSSTTTLSTMKHYDWIIGSDILYNSNCIPALVATIQRFMSTKTTKILLGVRWRKPEIERSFFQQLQNNCSCQWKLLSSSSTTTTNYCSLSWQEYGNPNSTKSNRYFSQTMIGIQGIPTPLSKITNEKSEQMTKKRI